MKKEIIIDECTDIVIHDTNINTYNVVSVNGMCLTIKKSTVEKHLPFLYDENDFEKVLIKIALDEYEKNLEMEFIDE